MAGPLFSTAECNFNASLANCLRGFGHEVFLPQEEEQGEDPHAVFVSDVSGIEWSELVLANLDGPDPDSGTCWEIGFGYHAGKHIGVYRTDLRLFRGADQINLMMTEGADFVIIVPKMPFNLLAERIDDQIKAYWPERKIKEISPYAPEREVLISASGRPYQEQPDGSLKYVEDR